MKYLIGYGVLLLKRLLVIFLFVVCQLSSTAQNSNIFIKEPSHANVFIEEKGQFKKFAEKITTPFSEKVYFGIENSEFNAYFIKDGIVFYFPERREGDGKAEKLKEEEKSHNNVIWHKVTMRWINANSSVQINPTEKVSSYYNYENDDDPNSYNFIPAFNKLTYKNLFKGVDVEFRLPKEGGIKYKLIVQPNIVIPHISFEWEGIDELSKKPNGDLLIKTLLPEGGESKEWKLIDKAPNAFTQQTKIDIPVQYEINKNKVAFKFNSNISSPEGVIIDPWIQNPAFPNLNKAYDIQTDSIGNIFIYGNYSTGAAVKYHVQKYNSIGVLQWTYVYYSIFLGDIAVDSPGNLYTIGGYPAGKRQKLDSSGVLLWSLPGLAEEWRLSFNKSKTVLSIGGYFNTSNNLAKLNTNTGVISNQIPYGAETRSIATDCNGDIYSLHVTFGGAGVAASNMLRKTNANFTPAGAVQSGFFLYEVGTGYAFNPDYSAGVFQGFNGIAISGNFLYISDGLSLRKFNKNTLTFINSVTIPNGSIALCGGLATDFCGNIYVGSLTGIVKYNAALALLSTDPTPGAVYDIISSNNGNLLACGQGFFGFFNANCIAPSPLSVVTTVDSCGLGSIALTVTGGAPTYEYLWSGGQTTSSISSLIPGVFTYVVNDAFCNTFTDSVQIFSSPIAVFTADTACYGYGNNFTDNTILGAANISSWNWDFNNDSVIDNTNQNPNYIFPSASNFPVHLNVVDSNGCRADTIITISVSALPIADFIYTNECYGVVTGFTDLSLSNGGTITNWSWDFENDGIVDNVSQNTSFGYPSAGSFTAELLVGTALGCVDSVTNTIVVNPIPVVNFNVTNKCFGDTALFNDLSTIITGTLTNYQWFFGDGNTSSLQNPTNLYATEGTYNVELLVTSSSGCVDSITQPIVIDPKPISQFTITDDCLYNNIVMTDGSNVTTGVITNWDWNFGDGTIATFQNNTYSYATDGTYNVTLIVTTDNSCTDTLTLPTIVYPIPNVNFTAPPVCLYDFAVFTDLSTINSPDNITSWLWSFGDGSPIVSSQNETHLYTVDGIYNVNLIVTSNNGCVAQLITPITIYPIPVPYFSSTSVCVNTPPTTFTDLTNISFGTIDFWSWNFADGNSSNLQNPTNVYIIDGVYNVQLISTSDFGCVADTTLSVIVNEKPTSLFTSNIDGCNPVPIDFTNISTSITASIIDWQWDLGNGSFSTSQNTSTVYTNSSNTDNQIYDVELIVMNDLGCYDTLLITNYITVWPTPFPDFYPNPASANMYETGINMVNTSIGGVNYQWNLDDNALSTDFLPFHAYSDTGTYYVTLITTSQYLCVDSITKPLEITPVVNLYVPNAFTPNGDGINDDFFFKGFAISKNKFNFYVFDRWGGLIYETHDFTPWDGTHKGVPVKTGVYVWKLKVKDAFDEALIYTGHVTLLR